MTTYQYLIIGGGMTAAAAVDGIREVDSTGSIGLIGEELDAPYDRPPLSKALWKGKPLDIIYYLQNSRVRGVLLWNVWDQVEAARHLIADAGPFTAKDLKGRIAPASDPEKQA